MPFGYSNFSNDWFLGLESSVEVKRLVTNQMYIKTDKISLKIMKLL